MAVVEVGGGHNQNQGQSDPVGEVVDLRVSREHPVLSAGLCGKCNEISSVLWASVVVACKEFKRDQMPSLCY
ncbi:hypothetical protein GALLR39Z86_32560 [Glycomyces algeriensis]|uniref:Uncharacterized protein n=1 Tax=Glycomyces algeriensis TaxID=256037 RepID=A0A9W6GAL4_9ACTN|nr:hypothetical protein GALLR39Z86_32560 [Glycomyces algeriensis]